MRVLKMTKSGCNYLLLIVFYLIIFQSRATVHLPAIFSSNMVLQQNQEVAIWGWGTPAEKVTVTGSWNNRSLEAIISSNAKWRITMQTPNAGGPYSIKIEEQNTLILENILIGEVWICSGQSNMEISATGLFPFDNAMEEVTNSNYPNIRLFHIEKSTADTRQEDLIGTWTECNPQTMKTFSGTAYFFGRTLHKDLDVPIGLIHASWGGTGAEVWTDSEIIKGDTNFSKNAEKLLTSVWWPTESGSAFNAMIAPIIPFGMAGVIWYQGESNKMAPLNYARLFPIMIRQWREEWDKEFPFYYVQVAPFSQDPPFQGVLLREAQLKSMSVPNTGMVVISDIADIDNIHPTNKQQIGYRLAQWALSKTYDRLDIIYSGPVYREMKIERKSIKLIFDYAENGFFVKGGELVHFEIAGRDKRFLPAKAIIHKNMIEVFNKKVINPIAVRFAWDNTAIPNLFNVGGLPASSFRTDDWDMEYLDRKN